jgi:hypothetical protein
VRAKLLQVKDYAEDDWTGVSDVQERRKRQNRLSKRAQRQYSMDVLSEMAETIQEGGQQPQICSE